ncbi:alkaline phosphatase [Clostridium perfringens]|nr:alkaline phosphatase [Clostridium perfringens]
MISCNENTKADGEKNAKGNIVLSAGNQEEKNNEVQKYIFYFIGDGLGASQRQAAEYYLQSKGKEETLKINSLPVAGINTTHALDTLVTDSAAAGTALATGHKTNSGVISQLPDGTNLKTVVEKAEEKGMATGIITSTRLTHATPAVFASHNESRGNENEIAEDYLDSGVDFFAGGGASNFRPNDGTLGKSKREDDKNLLEDFEKLGYKVFNGEESASDFRKLKVKGEEKVFATFTDSHLPYEVERMQDDNTPSLAEITSKGIEVLEEYKDGFLMMVEGGRIDHASHANDVPATVNDVLAFDEAVKVAYKFYEEHPEETLIVVAGDHETGGFGLGFGNNYFLNLEIVDNAKVSVEDTLQEAYTGDREQYFKYIDENLGLNNLSEEEENKIIEAMNIVDSGVETDEYGGYNPVSIVTTHIFSERANVNWTTYAHTGTQIPFSAVGVGADKFEGFKDNTEIGKSVFEILEN